MILNHEKYCKQCDTIKDKNDFYNQTASSDGKQGMCKACSHLRRKKYHLENKDLENSKTRLWASQNKHKLREWALRNTYGISQEDYEQMRQEQQECCAICHRHETQTARSNYKGDVKTSLHVDHCHTTGEIRGLLCFNCNALLGKCRDDPKVLQNAISYLKKEKKKREN